MSVTARELETNVSLHLRRWALEAPTRLAVQSPARDGGASLSFEELEERCDRIAHGLVELGLEPGDRACLFVRPGPDLIAITHALFRTGVVPVLIDPGMGRRNLLACVERMAPKALIGIPRAHVARRLFPRAFRSVTTLVTVGRRVAWGGTTLDQMVRSNAGKGAFRARVESASDAAAILFTSGSTGPPKGVAYTHGMFLAQLDALGRLYSLEPGEVDVACFPLFALFDNALGMSAVFPDLDPSRPATCDPRVIFETIENARATFTFGSPAIWRRIAPWAKQHGRRFTSLRRLTIAGAPVPPWLVAELRALLPAGGDVHTPYGATEALPVASISGTEIEALRARVEGGEGTCVGRPVASAEVALIEVRDEALESFDEALRVAPGELGEICVRGPMVTQVYEEDPSATRFAKMRRGNELWHRMGDLGRLDREGRLWFYGRKAHRLETRQGLLPPVPLENVFNPTRGVHRTALVGVGVRGQELPYLVVEPEAGASEAELLPRLEACRDRTPEAACIQGFLMHRGFPVDVRHNAKIHREALKRWAEDKLR